MITHIQLNICSLPDVSSKWCFNGFTPSVITTLFMLFISSNLFGQNYEAMRNEMIDQQLKARGIHDYEVLHAMQVVERQKYVPDELQHRSYGDHPLPIGHGQTISQPYIVALMTQLLEPSDRKKILEIGTGSGYQAAVLGELFGEVYSIEIIPELA